jgi:transporter family protein
MISAIIAGMTSVFAKRGLDGISSELGLVIRTLMVAGFVILFGLFTVSKEQWSHVGRDNLRWLAFSGIATAASWIFYYKALNEGDVATVGLIDKGSVLAAIAIAFFMLGERPSLRTMIGAGLIAAGIIVIARKS